MLPWLRYRSTWMATPCDSANMRNKSSCTLLSLPAELRLLIIGFALMDYRRTQYIPYIVYDSVYEDKRRRCRDKTAVLLTCKTIFEDCMQSLFGAKKIVIGLYDGEPTSDIRMHSNDIGTVQAWLSLRHFRHVEVLVVFNALDSLSFRHARDRIQLLFNTLNQSQQLISVQLGFIERLVDASEENHSWRANKIADSLLDLQPVLDCDQLTGVWTNIPTSLSAEKWKVLRDKAVERRAALAREGYP